MASGYDPGLWEDLQRAHAKAEASDGSSKVFVNLYAVITECCVPRKTAGSDFCANLTVEDASCPGQAKLSRGVEFIMFSRRPENLPQPSDCWKVLRMQQVTSQLFNNRPQLCGKPDSNAPFSYSIFDGALSAGTEPVRTVNAVFRPHAGHAEELRRVRQYALKHRERPEGLEEETEEKPTFLRKIRELEPPAAGQAPYIVDMLCRVLAVQTLETLQNPEALDPRGPNPQDATGGQGAAGTSGRSGGEPGTSNQQPSEDCNRRTSGQGADVSDAAAPASAASDKTAGKSRETVLYLWDGTDARPLDGGVNVDRAEYPPRGRYAGSPPSKALRHDPIVASRLRRTMPLQSNGEDVHVVPDLPALGTALPLVVPAAAGPVALPKAGDWVKLKVAPLQIVDGQMQLVYARGTRWTPRQQEDARLADSYAQRLAGASRADGPLTSEWAPDEPAGFAASPCTRDFLRRSTIREVLLSMPRGESTKFRVVARVVAVSDPTPLDSEPLSPSEQEAEGLEADGGEAGALSPEDAECPFAMSVTLEDATGTLPTVLCGAAARQFFGPLPADAAQASLELRRRAARLLAHSHGAGDGASAGGWVDACVQSVYADADSPIETGCWCLLETSMDEFRS